MSTSDLAFPPSQDLSDNNLQPFFVLHKRSSSTRKPERKSSGKGKTRRRIEVDDSVEKPESSEDFGDEICLLDSRFEAFETVWSTIESTIRDGLKEINTNVFDEIYQWVAECFNGITSLGMPTFQEATRPFSMAVDTDNKQLCAGLVLTKNMEFVDDLLTFKELGVHLKSKGCHVANLSSFDFSAKNGIGGCLKSLLRQFLMVTVDAPDISVLAIWYREQENHNNPIVVIVDDMERCCGSVLADFILMLSEWILKIPVILVMGIATTLDAVRNILPSNALRCASPCKFVLGTPSERMDAVAEAVLMEHCSLFSISHSVAIFIRNYFVNQDGTITSFIRALKIACAHHFSEEPLSLLLLLFHLGEAGQVLQGEKYGSSQEMMLKRAFSFPSSERSNVAEQTFEVLFHALSELKNSQDQWSIVMKCLYETLKFDKIQLLDLVCEALDPEFHKSVVCNTSGILRRNCRVSTDVHMFEQSPCTRKDGLFYQAVRKVRDLPDVQLGKLLKIWEKYTEDIPQIHGKVKELLLVLKLKIEDGKSLKHNITNSPNKCGRRNASWGRMNIDKCDKTINDKAVTLLDSMIRTYMKPIECLAFHEIVCFKNVDKLQAALIGEPRREVQVDLMEFNRNVHSTCCGSGNTILPSLPESSILYSLAREHGDLVNLHDWYQSFKLTVLPKTSKGKQRSKHSPSPKKRKVELAKPSEASIQARFCKAITELQITGLVRMPSKRRPDYVQRVAFGV